jgi:cytochrome c peroxidase
MRIPGNLPRRLVLPAGLALLTLSGAWLAAEGQGIPGTRVHGEFERGESLFFTETFRGNGRTCGTCHDPVSEFTISPALVQSRFAQDPNHPLFRPLDSNDGEGRDFSNLLNHAVVTVRIPLHPRVFLPDNPAQRSIIVWRGTPSIANVALTAPYLHDGRAATLQEQAAGAIDHHMQPGRAPRRMELDAIAGFQKEIFYPLRIRSLLDPEEPLTQEEGFSVPVSSPAAQRGQSVFIEHCTRCHALELGHRSDVPDARIFVRTFVSDANRLGLPVLRLGFMNPDATISIVETPDPGRAAITGSIEDLNAFETPMLRGLKHTAPYFHDNSAKTLSDVVNHYNEFFGFGIIREDRDDLISFLELL